MTEVVSRKIQVTIASVTAQLLNTLSKIIQSVDAVFVTVNNAMIDRDDYPWTSKQKNYI